MLFNQVAPLLLLAGSAIAAPLAEPQNAVVVKQLVVTETVMAGAAPTGQSGQPGQMGQPGQGRQGHHWGPPGGQQQPPSSTDSSDSVPTPASQPSQAPQAPQKSQPAGSQPAGSRPGKTATAAAPSSTSTGSTSTGSTSSGGSSSYIDQINKYRGMMNKGLKTMTMDSTLQANCQKTVNDDNGTMKHELNPGSMAQVLAQGECTDAGFLDALVHGWICEIPSLLPSGTCNGGGYSSGGETGHAEILSSTSYTKAGCACADKIWGCDFS